MKTWMRACLLTAATATALTVGASAANFTSRADDLRDMGLFKGSELGYELDRAPQRAEAAVMLVRLLGAETEAMEANIVSPFTDVPEWAAPYIGWLYQEGLTSGATATTFEPYGTCSSQMYATFLLRALGYSDAQGDFTYADAIPFAASKQVVDMVNYNPDAFLRDNMVAMSYTALAQDTKDSDTSLLATLVADGAIDADKAADTLAFFDAYGQMEAVMATAQQSNTMHVTGTMTMQMGEDGALGTVSAATDSVVSTMFDAADINASKVAMEGTITQTLHAPNMPAPQTTTQQTSAYFADGVCYTVAADAKIKMPLDFSAMYEMQASSTQATPICFYDSIVIDGGSYTMTLDTGAYDAAVSALMGNLLDMPAISEDTQTTVNEMAITVSADKQGNLMNMVTSANMQVAAPQVTMYITMENVCEIIAMGEDVTITAPTDLDSYISMEEFMASQQ